MLLRLVNLALQRVPKMVRDDRGATALTIFGQILPLLAQERLRCARFVLSCLQVCYDGCPLDQHSYI